MAKTYKDCSLEELDPLPMNYYIYAVHVMKSPLPDEYHRKMLSFLESDPGNMFVIGYLRFIGRDSLWDRAKRFFGWPHP
jgi:hypothetical protein